MQHTTLVERLTREIVDTIRAEKLVPGQALPSARTFAERFEVTVPTVREALRRLEATDVIELRHGSGTYVGASIDRRLLVNQYYSPRKVQDALELVDARIAIEPGIAALAATNHDHEDLALLTDSLDNARTERSAPASSHFHTRIAGATGNRALRETIESLLTIHAQSRQTARIHYDRDQDHAEHALIRDAIASRDADAAADAVRRHLVSIRETLAVAGGGA